MNDVIWVCKTGYWVNLKENAQPDYEPYVKQSTLTALQEKMDIAKEALESILRIGQESLTNTNSYVDYFNKAYKITQEALKELEAEK